MKPEKNLGDLKKNEVCYVTGYTRKAYYQKLLPLGLVPGTRIKMIRKAPLGDPIQFEVLGANLCLRRKEANSIKVEKISA